jgi:hypothetical protein
LRKQSNLYHLALSSGRSPLKLWNVPPGESVRAKDHWHLRALPLLQDRSAPMFFISPDKHRVGANG